MGDVEVRRLGDQDTGWAPPSWSATPSRGCLVEGFGLPRESGICGSYHGDEVTYYEARQVPLDAKGVGMD